jgi:hypothetical protein
MAAARSAGASRIRASSSASKSSRIQGQQFGLVQFLTHWVGAALRAGLAAGVLDEDAAAKNRARLF